MCIASNPGQLPMSPRSEAKARKQHHLLKDKRWGYLCTLNSGTEPCEVTSKPCFPLPEVGELTETPVKTKLYTVNNAKAEEQVLRAELAELEEQERNLALLLELQELHEEEARLLEADLQEREDLHLAMAISKSESEAGDCKSVSAEGGVSKDSGARSSHEVVVLANPTTAEGLLLDAEPLETAVPKIASVLSAENIAAEILETRSSDVTSDALIGSLIANHACCFRLCSPCIAMIIRYYNSRSA